MPTVNYTKDAQPFRYCRAVSEFNVFMNYVYDQKWSVNIPFVRAYKYNEMSNTFNVFIQG